MEHVWECLRWAFGADVASPRDLNALQACLRALVVYFAGLVVLRVGERRSIGRGGIFDVVLAFILGSVLSRAINGSGGLLSTIAVTVFLVGLHRLMALGAFHSRRFGSFVKGDASLLVHDGERRTEALRRHHISEHDLMEGLHLHEIGDVSRVEAAWIERSGDISAVQRPAEPRLLEVEVEAGVQRVRIEIS